MAEYRIPTPDAPVAGVGFRHWVLRVPDIDIVRSAILGALYDLGRWSTWVQEGNMTENEVAWLIKDMIVGRLEMDFMIGTIVPVITDTLESNLLLADGQTVLRVDYPELWEKTPAALRTANDLTLPDLTDRFIIGSGVQFANLSIGGEVEHQLTVPELPPHAHGYTQYTFGIDIESVGVPDPTGVGNPRLPESTDQTGGGQPHNNMPPFYALKYAVIARLS